MTGVLIARNDQITSTVAIIVEATHLHSGPASLPLSLSFPPSHNATKWHAPIFVVCALSVTSLIKLFNDCVFVLCFGKRAIIYSHVLGLFLTVFAVKGLWQCHSQQNKQRSADENKTKE